MTAFSKLYPLKFKPILKEKIWGGRKLYKLYEQQGDQNIGESWLISDVEDNISEIQNGEFKGKSLSWLLESFQENLVGKRVYENFGNKFPLLFKIIDAKEDLSVQLHPNDSLAKQRHNSFGKTEMWYIMQTEEDARIILGFKEDIEEETYLKHLQQGKITQILHLEDVKNGDAFLVDPGTIHAIGSGVLLAEIQQTSDITYRVYDWDRPDENGDLRELHNDLVLEAIDYSKYPGRLKYEKVSNQSVKLVETPFFKTDKLRLTQNITRDLSQIPSFTVYMCVEGQAKVKSGEFLTDIKVGECILIPKSLDQIQFLTNSATLLEVYIP